MGAIPYRAPGLEYTPPPPKRESWNSGFKTYNGTTANDLIAKVLLMRYAHTHKRYAHVCIHAANTYRNGSRKRSLALLHRSSPAMAAGFEVN